MRSTSWGRHGKKTIICKECLSKQGFKIQITPDKILYVCKKCNKTNYELDRGETTNDAHTSEN